MKIEKLRIGKTYYLPQRGCPTSYTSGVLVEIVSKNKVILENKKGNRFSCNTNKLHKSPDKAVRGRKAQERVRHEMNVKKQKDRENLVDKGVQDKIKKLGHSTFGIKGDAREWYGKAPSSSKGTTIKSNSIACMSNSRYGHVELFLCEIFG